MPVVPLGVHCSRTVYTGAAVPVPVSVLTVGELLALLANDAVADAEPAAAGVNVTVKLTGVAVVTVTGKVKPLTENSVGFVPPIVTDVTLTLPPVAVRVPLAVPFSPTTTLPTAIGVVTLSEPAAAVPVPVRLATAGELLALLANDAVALAEPVAVGENFTVNVTGVPVVTVTGKVNPVTENSDEFVPPIVTDVTLTLPPVAVRVPLAVPLEFTATLPTAIGVVTASDPATPVPVRLATAGEFVALLANDAVALAEPVAVGENFTVNVTGVVVVTVAGKVRPVTLNSAAFVPPIVTDDTVTVPPVAVRVPVAVPLNPTPTLPTAIGVLTARVADTGATAEPVSGIDRFGLEAVEVTATLPVKLLPADCGAKFTLNDVVPPAARVKGRVGRPETLKPVPLAVIAETVALTPPLLVNVTDWLEFCPTVTLVKVTLGGVAAIVAGDTEVPLSGTDN